MSLALEFIFLAGSVVCHQLPDRSFFLDGRQFPVCARCTGLYLSGLAGLAAWLGWKIVNGWRPLNVSPRVALRLLIVAALPTAISYSAGISGIWDGSNLARAVFAVPLGVTAGGVVAAVFTKDLR